MQAVYKLLQDMVPSFVPVCKIIESQVYLPIIRGEAMELRLIGDPYPSLESMVDGIVAHGSSQVEAAEVLRVEELSDAGEGA
jgi:hypothetical protein